MKYVNYLVFIPIIRLICQTNLLLTMKKTYCILVVGFICLLTISCNNTSNKIIIPTESSNFDWLLGKWSRLNETPGKQTYENWEKTSATEYTGFGFTLQNQDTLSLEKIILKEKDGKWWMSVRMSNEKESTIFRIAEMSKERFVCINDSIEFPNRIVYWREQGLLKAEVSNDSTKIEFEFKEIK